jgi:hypothetical protein
MAKSIRRIILHTAKAIARDPDQPGKLLFTDAGTELDVPSPGVTAKLRNAWLVDGSAGAIDIDGSEPATA